MRTSQQLGKDIANTKNKAREQSEDYQLNNTNSEQQFHSRAIEEIVYNAADHHVTFQKTQRSYEEQRNQYVEQAFNDYSSVEDSNAGSHTYNYEQPAANISESNSGKEFSRSYGVASDISSEKDSSSVSNDSLLSGTAEKYGLTMTAEAPKLWNNTYSIQKNNELREELEDKRKYVKRGNPRLTLGEKSINQRLRFNYGRDRLKKEVVREKQTLKGFQEELQEKDRRAFKRRAAGRLLFSKGRSLLNDENISEDDEIASIKRTGRRIVRGTALSVRRNVRNLKMNNNVYARLRQADMKNQVLLNRRERLLSDSKKKMQMQQLQEAQSREQKRKLKRKMVQQHAREEGNFFQRAKQQFLVKKTAYEYRQIVKKRTLTTLWSTAVLIMIIVMLLMFLLLIVLAASQGGSEYYATAVTQNDYGTITEATEYFRKLETDLDEYLNTDREALEAELGVEYGSDIYEYIYDLAEFGFSANTLIAYLSAVYVSFSLEDVKEELDDIFAEMYTLNVEIKVEERDVQYYNPESGEYYMQKELKNICYITLEKKELEEVVEARLPDDLKAQYDAYKLSTGGQQVYGPVMQEDWTNLISSTYGERIHPITKVRTFHKGVDIAVPEGTKLYSAIKGVVTISKYSESAGNYVTIQNDNGWTVTFMHMSARAVTEGQRIEQGDFVGLSGNTGNSTGAHLHLQVADANGNTINPIFIIPQTCAAINMEE